MKFKIYPLRIRGTRRSWQNVLSGPSYVGDLRTQHVLHGTDRVHVASLVVSGGRGPQPLLDLYEPQLQSIATGGLRLRGYERLQHPSGTHDAVQEWHCEPVQAGVTDLEPRAGQGCPALKELMVKWATSPSRKESGR
jgi:hypothetical protein